MTLTNAETKKLLIALQLAMRSEENFIDAHRTQFANGTHGYLKRKVVPPEHRAIVQRAARNIKAWKRLCERLMRHNDGGERR